MLIWSIFLTGVVALLFFMMYPRTDYIQTVETPIAQTAIVQFTTQHKNALNLALKAVETAANRTDETYTNNLTIYYPDFATLDKTKYLPDGLDQLDWEDDEGNSLIQSRIVCINYDTGATANLSTMGTCSIGGYTSTAQTPPISSSWDYNGTRDYLITYAPKPTYIDADTGDEIDFATVFPGWGTSWNEETKNIDTCGIVKDGKIQSPKCPGGLCDLSASANTTRLQNLITASGLTLENDGFICISPIDHYAYDGVSITGKNPNMLAYYDGINNTWTGHSNTTTTWYDLSGNGNNAYFYEITTNGNTNATAALTSVSGWKSNGYKFSGELEFLSLPESFTAPVDDLKEQGVEIVADIVEPEDLDGRTFFVGLGNYYIAQSARDTGKYRFNTMIGKEGGLNAWAYSRFLSPAEEKIGKFSLSTIWKTNYKLMTQDLYLYGEKANNAVHADKFQYKKNDRSGIGAKMRNAIGISYNGASPSYPKRVYVSRLYNTRLTPAQIALNYQLDRKRFNIPKVTDNNGNDYTYLQGDGTSYIQTDYVPNANTQVKLTILLPTEPSGAKWLYGSRLGMNQKAFAVFWENSGGYKGVFLSWGSAGNQYVTEIKISKDIKYNIFQDKNKLTVNDITTTNTGAWETSTYPMAIFTVNTNGTIDDRKLNMKLYSFKILENDALQHDLIPAEDPFGRPAMYDKISGKFFYNAASSGEFTLGND